VDADKNGYTKNEYDQLCRPGNPLFALTRLSMQTLGRLSDGIKLGWQYGFDSGRALDYVYENRPRGITPLGRLMDYSYLNSIGWRGIRLRKQNLQTVLRDAIARTQADAKPVRLLDIASGPGRYVLETLHQLNGTPASALLRDYKPENIEAARKLTAELGLKNVVVEQGDAFDRPALAALTPKPTIAIISGLFELFPDNEPVLKSLRGVDDAIAPGGYLIYTNQPWHPQVEMIARVLPNRDGQPWIMRRRAQGEMDSLVREAGFTKAAQWTDDFGIFTVAAARKP
jgi:SAM-dependent methyltransferase